MALHVMPVNDYHMHDESAACWCKPTVEDGPEYSEPLVIHNLLQDTEAH